MVRDLLTLSFFFFNDTATTEIYTLSLHDALPISAGGISALISKPKVGKSTLARALCAAVLHAEPFLGRPVLQGPVRSEEHTSELQSPCNLVCRLLLEKKKHTASPQSRSTSNRCVT